MLKIPRLQIRRSIGLCTIVRILWLIPITSGISEEITMTAIRSERDRQLVCGSLTLRLHHYFVSKDSRERKIGGDFVADIEEVEAQ